GQFTEALANVIMFPYQRFNALLIAAPKQRMQEVVTLIKKFDRESPSIARVTPFVLKRAQASRVGQMLSNFYNSRYAPFESTQQNQIRITWDDNIQTVFVQAAPGDLEEIAELIDMLDGLRSATENELRLVPLKYALPDVISQLIQAGIT